MTQQKRDRLPESQRSQIRLWCAVFCLALTAACVERPMLVPATGAALAMATSHMASLTASATEWPGDPSIYDSVVPFAVQLHNKSDIEVLVNPNDFYLEAGDGFRINALDPFARALSVYDPEEGAGFDAERGMVELAAYHYTPQRDRAAQQKSSPSKPNRSSPPPSNGGAYYPPYAAPMLGWGFWGSNYWGYSPYGGWWGYPFGPPGWWWGGFYSGGVSAQQRTPPALHYALRKGSLAPRGTTRGYVFFPRPRTMGNEVALVWLAKNSDGQIISRLRASFVSSAELGAEFEDGDE